jgi:2-polyprenyl-3-methyl-5-hydroxy-6-metoxy-1,4-benzoquinol methylase
MRRRNLLDAKTMSHDSLLCWCGNNHLQRFSPEYDRCLKCETLISRHKRALTAGLTAEGDKGFYGRKYYESHLVEKYHYPSLPERARGDLSERCIHWLQILLHCQLPPSRILEIGSGHGGFVALARWAGFEAVGLEISPWVVDFAKETFQIPMLLGSVENQVLQPSSLGAVILMDVLEHFPDPCGTMRTCFDWLKPDGIFLVQTPKYSGDSTYDQLVARKDRFLEQLKADEHLFLFSEKSIRVFFERLGAPHIHFEPAIFAHYDMFFAVGRQSPKTFSQEEILRFLLATPNGRLVQALFDLKEKIQECETDRALKIAFNDHLASEIKRMQTSLSRIKTSLSWRITKPLRFTQEKYRQFFHLASPSSPNEKKQKQ